MGMQGRDAWEQLDEIRRRNARQRAQFLARSQAAAVARGKEPFDLEKLEKMCDTTSEGRLDPVEDRQAHFEYLYYVLHPECMTLAEFVDVITRLSKW